MIFGGNLEGSGYIPTAEIIDLNDSNNICETPEDLPITFENTFGGLITNHSTIANLAIPMVCGGSIKENGIVKFGDKCYSFDGHRFDDYITLDEPRFGGTAVVFDESKVWIAGGSNGFNLTKSTEIFYQQYHRVDSGDDLPSTTYDHCSVKINETHALILGKYL